VLSVGAIEPHKGFDFLIRSIARIPASTRPRLIIVGNTDDSGISQRLLCLSENEGVTLDVFTDIDARGPELVDLYQRARAFVFTAYAEPFGLVLLEAMACGIPVVSVDEGGPREIVAEGETGYLVRRDETLFAEALRSLLEDEPLARRMGKRSRELAVERWTWERAAQGLEHELSSVIGAGVGVAG
jgi:glycosyltransferase involved in cell wall biosynthesis